MLNVMASKTIVGRYYKKEKMGDSVMNLTQADINTKYEIKNIHTNDEELKNFMFTLGCYEGENITVISVLAENYIITVKDARYSIDKDLAKTIIL